MALPKTKKKIIPDISDAVQRAAGTVNLENQHGSPNILQPSAKGGRPSPRSGNVVRQTLLLSEETAERLTMAYAGEQIKRRKTGEKLDKSLFIEEMIIAWLEQNPR
ncbi:hypothetical protein [Desulfopila aestuarii]|uniref:Uncharacterized protein n=1 Tax=Desulfopila aestuarii DSM 18488 TaxID=1121416 RepID=A0A1M7XZV3_9BACT|nr:hypothetical protein [Desulfopila aestuarii]SHO44792.1 hypothetical protein SAMN02745220_00878 [Desulfopila aestuarii DSM 18488]